MLPFRSSRSSTLPMSNFSYFASRTPSATFSKSQKTAMLRVSGVAAIGASSASKVTTPGSGTSSRRRRHTASTKEKAMNQEQVKELMLQSLEHEKCGVEVYQTALQCVRNDDLKEEFRKYHQQTRTHVQILTDLCIRMEIDPDAMSPGREVVRMMGNSLVEAMRKAGQAGRPEAAEIVAC